MAPGKKGQKNTAEPGPSAPPGPGPALLKSVILNEEGLDKVRPLATSARNRNGATKIWPTSGPAAQRGGTIFLFFLHSVFTGLVPAFFDFFDAMLSHYQVHALHLHPSSVLLLPVFAYLCEAFLGVMPSVAFLRKFFRLRLTAADQCSGCVSFQIAEGMRVHIIDM